MTSATLFESTDGDGTRIDHVRPARSAPLDPALSRDARHHGRLPGGVYTTPEKVSAARRQSGYFDAAVRIILREHRKREREAATAAHDTVSVDDFGEHVGTGHAKEIVMHADISALLLLSKQVADAADVEVVNGLPVIDWFNRERRVHLEREVLAIGNTDPEFAAHIQRQLDWLRWMVSAGSIVEPLDG